MGTEITRTDVLARASELLTRAEALITPPRRWTQRAHARDARGHIVSYIAPDARAWCLLGAIDRMYMAMLHMQPRNVAMYQRARRARPCIWAVSTCRPNRANLLTPATIASTIVVAIEPAGQASPAAGKGGTAWPTSTRSRARES